MQAVCTELPRNLMLFLGFFMRCRYHVFSSALRVTPREESFGRLLFPFGVVLACLSMLLGTPGIARCEANLPGWLAHLAGNPTGPPMFLAVNKHSQELYVFEQKSPLALVEKITCTTGEVLGDKMVEGDLRTPEGVYFIQNRLDSGLDFGLYGPLAHTLNYPNPVDKLKGKTGYGIWIHGRGHDIRPMETQGCVALNNPDLVKLDKMLHRHLPVVIAQNVAWQPELHDPKHPKHLLQLVSDWAEAWQARSSAFFEFYDGERFSQSGSESFGAFRSHKESLFSNLPWIQVRAHNVRALPGPDYWVTWFDQYYRSPTLTSGGTKRLYWMQNGAGAWRIVGREWVSADAEATKRMEARYLLDALQDMRQFVDQWRTAWADASLKDYLTFYSEQASQGSRQGREAIAAHKQLIWQEKHPVKVDLGALNVKLHPQGLEVGFSQSYQDAKGYADEGYKTLVVEPSLAGVAGWKIVAEDWSAM